MNRNQQLLTLAALSLVSLASSGCIKHITVLREAQTIFNKSAEADNRQHLAGEPLPVDETSGGYAVAQKMLENLVAKKKSDLKKDNLLCTTLAIRALALWRLGRFDDARTLAVSDDAQECSNNANQAPRDVALLLTIPALIRIDEANQKYVQDRKTYDQADSGSNFLSQDWAKRQKRFEEIKEKIYGLDNGVFENRGALCALQKASEQAGDVPVQIYFRMSMLAGIRVVHAATEIDLPTTSEDLTSALRDAENKEAMRRAALVDIALRRATGLEPDPKKSAAAAPEAAQNLSGWELLFGISDTVLKTARTDPVDNFCEFPGTVSKVGARPSK
jgi:hypothetical protein